MNTLKDTVLKFIERIDKKDWWIPIHALALTGLLARLSVAFYSNQIDYPDEIFQYLEQSHRLVFGYGYVPWEYRFGIRSWILPGLVSPVLYLCKYLRVDTPVVYISLVKAFFCIFSISLVYSTYIVGRETVSRNTGRLGSIFVCFWYELIYFASKPNPEIIATYLFMAALACAVLKPGRRWPLMFGMFCALIIVFRLQYAILSGFLIIYVLFSWKRNEILKASLMFFVAIGFAGYIDYLTWGGFFVSFYNNYVFNKIHNVGALLGTSPAIFYPAALAITSMGIFWITGLMSLFTLRKTWMFLACAAIVIISHSLIPHKEYRFIVVVIPLFLMLFSIVIMKGLSFFDRVLGKSVILIITVCGFLVISFVGSLNRLPFQTLVYKNSLFTKQEILDAYLTLFESKGLHAILNTATPWTLTGGYYYLHRDVPIYSINHFTLNGVSNFSPYVSHIICRIGEGDINGFEPILRLQTIEIRQQTHPPPQYGILPIDTKNVLVEEIDGEYDRSKVLQ